MMFLEQALFEHLNKIQICRYITIIVFVFSSFQSTAQDFSLEKLPASVNSMYDEISPVVSRDGKTLYFTRVGDPGFCKTLFFGGVDFAVFSGAGYDAKLGEIFNQISGTTILDPVASSFNQDAWYADMNEVGEVLKLNHPDFPLNSALPNSIVATTPDENAFICINQYDDKGFMLPGFSLIRKTGEDSWSMPEPIEIGDFYTLTSEVSLTMSFDGQLLILSATRQGSADMDLYMSRRLTNGTWSAPKHLGSDINSPSRETTPFLSEDNESLFFSSDRVGTFGGNDIFMSKRLDDSWQKWSSPQRLSKPVNSSADDSQPYFNMTTGFIYFSSKREGSSDIYRVKIAPPQPTEILLSGRIINGLNGQLVQTAAVHYGAKDSPKNLLQTKDGYYALSIPKGVTFELTPEKPAFTGQAKDIFFPRAYRFFQDTYVVDLVLNPLAVNAIIELRPIYYVQSKSIILEQSYPELERLAQLLTESKSMHIRVEGHTDNIGKEKDLYRLSEERAQAVKDFLIKKGIAADRIEVRGYGAKFPLNANKTNEQKEKNRRVEVRIIKV